ncbi:HAD family hydrolase [Qipengyuania sp. 483]
MAVKLPRRAAMKVAIYDLDKTLVRKATFTPFLAFAARRLAPWRLLFLPVWIAMMLGYRAGLYDRTTLKTAGMRLMLGQATQGQLNTVGRNFAGRHLASAGWIANVIAMVEEDRAQGAQLIVATAAFEFYAKAFAESLDIPHVIATQWNDWSIPGCNCYGAEKARRVSEWLEQHSIEGEMRFVSDSFADAPLLDRADDAVFVTSSPAKARRAQARGWRVIAP